MLAMSSVLSHDISYAHRTHVGKTMLFGETASRSRFKNSIFIVSVSVSQHLACDRIEFAQNSIEFDNMEVLMQFLATAHDAIVSIFMWIYSFVSHPPIAFQLQDFFASVQRVSSKTDNNRPSGDGNCYELGNTSMQPLFTIYLLIIFSSLKIAENFSLPENTRSCWPVRPIPRRNFMHEASAMNDSHPLSSGPNQGGGSNAAIGVVIPTTPNSTLHHQQQNHINEQLLQHNNHHHHHQYNMNNLTATPPSSQTKNHNHHNYNHIDADNLMMSRANLYAKYESRKRIPTAVTTTPATTTASTNGLNVEDRLNQIQDYIRITTTLLDSIQGEKVSHQTVSSVHAIDVFTRRLKTN